MLKVGLTGGIASGKTTVAEMLAARGCRVLYADRIAHELMAPGQPAYDEIVRAFGRDILHAGGAIDRRRLGEIVFADAARRAELNRIVHPRVIAEIEMEFARLAAAQPDAIVVVEAALLIEAGYHRRLDKLIVTVSTPEQQLERLMKKTGLSRTRAEERLAAQLPAEEKRRHADYEIDCSGSLAATEQQVEKLLAEWRRLAGRSRV
ncbi:MAG: dephospho-CoA kinase [Acidobacteria bacterium]|nr:dephospho-CoA kinase [Acidobacteriota bacterium]